MLLQLISAGSRIHLRGMMLVHYWSSFQTMRAYWNSIAEVFAIARKLPQLLDGYVRTRNTERAHIMYIHMYVYAHMRIRVSRCDVMT